MFIFLYEIRTVFYAHTYIFVIGLQLQSTRDGVVMTKIYFHSSGDIEESECIGMVDSSGCYRGGSVSDFS